MSTDNPSPNPNATTNSKSGPPKEIRLYSHSGLLYWWPVWAIGFILAVLTYWQNYHMVVVPVGSKIANAVEVEGLGAGSKVKDLKLPKEQEVQSAVLIPTDAKDREGNAFQVNESKLLRTSRAQGLGVFFLIVLMIVIIITNVPLRGMWSVLVIVTIFLISIIFATLGWWDDILQAFKLLDIRINMGGYLLISIMLLVVWLVTFFLFDRQLYVTFTPGQMKVHLEIGGGEVAYDTRGMTVKKERSDLFRHWVLGLGSGDLIIRTSGADAHEFRLNNVLFIGRKHKIVEQMQQRAGVT